MDELPNCFEAVLAAWNEKDPSKVRGHLDKALASNVLFADPHYYIKGIDAFYDMVKEFHVKYPVSRCEHTSGYNVHNNRYRYNWLVSINNQPVVAGMDVTEINEDGKIVRVDGFFGDIPPKY